MSDPAIFSVERLDFTFAPKPWAFALERRAEIEAFFAALQREKPEIWNGRVLLLHSRAVREGVFSGEFLETDYASFSAWIAWDCPPAGVCDCFGAAALKARDAVRLLETVLAIELMCAAQALEFLKPLHPGAGVQAAYERVRGVVAPLVQDRVLAPDIAALEALVRSGVFAAGDDGTLPA